MRVIREIKLTREALQAALVSMNDADSDAFWKALADLGYSQHWSHIGEDPDDPDKSLYRMNLHGHHKSELLRFVTDNQPEDLEFLEGVLAQMKILEAE